MGDILLLTQTTNKFNKNCKWECKIVGAKKKKKKVFRNKRCTYGKQTLRMTISFLSGLVDKFSSHSYSTSYKVPFKCGRNIQTFFRFLNIKLSDWLALIEKAFQSTIENKAKCSSRVPACKSNSKTDLEIVRKIPPVSLLEKKKRRGNTKRVSKNRIIVKFCYILLQDILFLRILYNEFIVFCIGSVSYV